MKVVLLDNVKGVGQVGDVKNVTDGYARNFLIPKGAAKPVTEGILKDVQILKAKKLQSIELAKSQAQELAVKIEGMKIEMPGRANEQGTLFAGIEARDIAKVISHSAGLQISPSQIRLERHIKTLGEHPVKIELVNDVLASLTLNVISER